MKTALVGFDIPVSEDDSLAGNFKIVREGLRGIDLFKKGRNMTKWEEVETITVFKDKVVLKARKPEDINEAFQDYENKKLIIRNITPVEVDYFEKNKLPTEYEIELDTEEERCIVFWRDAQKYLLVYRRQSGKIGEIDDNVSVFKKQFPEIKFECKIPEEKGFKVKEVSVMGKVDFREVRSFATFNEYAKEIEEGKVSIKDENDQYHKWSVEYRDTKYKTRAD